MNHYYEQDITIDINGGPYMSLDDIGEPSYLQSKTNKQEMKENYKDLVCLINQNRRHLYIH